MDQVRIRWGSVQLQVWKLQIHEKLRFVKEKLKLWNKEIFCGTRIKKREILEELEFPYKEKCEGGSE